jgi:ubiquitin-protein ligase
MNAHDQRRMQDIQKLEKMEQDLKGRVKVARVNGTPPSEVELHFNLKVASSERYPQEVGTVTKCVISLPARYPFVEPSVTVTTPIIHPNIYTSGKICLGQKWMPSFGLDLLAKRIIQIITYDPNVIDLNPPANSSAASWYKKALAQNRSAFPTDRMDFNSTEKLGGISWKPMASEPAKSIVKCPQCASALSVPSGKTLDVKCPKCSTGFRIRS